MNHARSRRVSENVVVPSQIKGMNEGDPDSTVTVSWQEMEFLCEYHES
jgi:hypothetical protein